MPTSTTASQGLVVSQGDHAMGTDAARAAYGVDGTGLTVGILSGSFNLLGGESADIANGDLPGSTTILAEGSDTGAPTDEGRAMAQIVHDVAPGASILFATAEGGLSTFASNIMMLAKAGAKIIVDDFFYPGEPTYQNSVVTQAINTVTSQMGVTYVTAAGNNGIHGYEAPFTPASSMPTTIDGRSEILHIFAPGQTYIPVTIGRANTTISFDLQWDSPAASISPGHGSTADLDVFLYDGSGKLLGSATAAGLGGDPIQTFRLTSGNAPETFRIAVGLHDGTAPDDFRLVSDGDGVPVSFGRLASNISTATIQGHHAAAGAISVGEAVYQHTPAYGAVPPTLDANSAVGPSHTTYDTAGNRLANAIYADAPTLVGPDGADTTFFGNSGDTDGDGYPNYFGTSAAAPHVAALAALVLQANPNLSPADVRALLQDSAIDMDNPGTPGFDAGIDVATGSGFVQGGAVGYAATGVITNDAHKTLMFGTHLADTFVGGAGGQTMTGHGGPDMFRDTAADLNGDTITDFGNADTIVVSDAHGSLYNLAYANGSLSFSLSADGSGPSTLTLGGSAFAGTLHQHADASGTGVDITFSQASALADANSGSGVAQALTGTVLANDTDASGGQLHVAAVQFASGPAHAVAGTGTTQVAGDHGILTIGGSGAYSYQPTSSGHDVFAESVADAAGNRDSTSLTFDVSAAAIPPSASFGFALGDAHFDFSHGHDLMTAPDGTVTDLTGIGTIAFKDGTVQESDGAPLVDDLYYEVVNPDVWAAHVDPDQHYAQYGWHEGRDPNAYFSTSAYLAANPDVKAAGIDPLQHYDTYGWHEGRGAGIGFSAEAYLAVNPDVKAAGLDPLAHELAYGQAEGRTTLPGETAAEGSGDHVFGDFDATFYLATYRDVAAAAQVSGVNPDSFAFTHYLQYGASEGRNPDPDFSTSDYLAANPDVAAAGVNPLLHYEQYGWHEGRDPSSSFHTDAYLAAYPDVAAAQIDPLQHFLDYGIAEGRHGA